MKNNKKNNKEKSESFYSKIKKEIEKKSKSKFTLIELVIIVALAMLVSSIVTIWIFLAKDEQYVKLDDNIANLIGTYNTIVDNYYEDVDKEKVIEGGIKGMLDSVGDPYTQFLDETASNNFNITLTGSYKGLGVEVAVLDKKLTIAGIFKDSPAAESGLKLGDVILSIDDKSSDDMSSADFSKYVRESEKDEFDIKVSRDGKELSFKIAKKEITLKSVSFKTFDVNDKKVGYIYISIFANNTYTQFKEELAKLEQQNIDSLILDLRDNSGGELEGASNMISLFLNNDKIIYQLQTKQDTQKIYSTGTLDKKYPIVVLVNGNTASASEVMTAALKENLNATVVGSKTYGKGTVQNLLQLNPDVEYKITTKKWLTPNGNWVNKTGIVPDVEVDLSKDYQKNPSDDTDNQLQAAIKYIKEH